MTGGLVLLALAAGVPIILAALGELILQRTGMINIGLEGVLLGAALGAVVAAKATESVMIGVAGGIAGAAVIAAVFSVASIVLKSDQVIAGAAANFVAIGLTGLVYRRWSGSLVSGVPGFSDEAQRAFLVSTWIIAPLLVWALLWATRPGFRMRATGENPAAVRLNGLDADGYRWAAVGCQVLLAGLAGSYLSLALSHGFAENMTAGRGFIALAIVIFGRWRPAGVAAGAALFALSVTLQYYVQAADARVSYHLLLMLPYAITLTVLALMKGGTRGPEALGQLASRN